MTTKQLKVLTAVLLILVAFVTMVGTVQAINTEYESVTFDYDSAQCSLKVMAEIEEGRFQEVKPETDSTTYLVKKDRYGVKVIITPVKGSKAELLDPTTGEPLLNQSNTYFLDPLYENYTIRITNETYTIIEKPADDYTHTPSFNKVVFEYKQATPVVLGTPSRPGYEFNGWKLTNAATGDFIFNVEKDMAFNTSDTGMLPNVGEGTEIWATPRWVGQPQEVYRYDCEYSDDPGIKIPVNGDADKVVLTFPNGTKDVTGMANSADEGDVYKTYIGYLPFDDTDEKYYTSIKQVRPNVTQEVYRYYVPITYTLVYENIDDPEAYPASHVYNKQILFSDYAAPTRVGYDFDGWRVYITKGGVRTDVTELYSGNQKIMNLKLDKWAKVLADGNDDSTIILEATWKAQEFEVVYDFGFELDAAQTEIYDALKVYKYDQALTIPNPARVGYIFRGWKLNGATEPVYSEDGLILPAETYTNQIFLVACWEAKTYTVTLNGNGGAWGETLTAALENVTFDQPIDVTDLALPTRLGYTLLGFYANVGDGEVFYIRVTDGSAIAEGVWNLDETAPVLYAKWAANPYNITINADHAEEIKVNVNGVESIYTSGDILSVHYDDVIKISITTQSGYKVTALNGAAVSHTALYEFDFLWSDNGAADATLNVTVLPVTVNPFDPSLPDGEKATVDYVNETLELPEGSYTISDGETVLNVTVTKDGILVNGEEADAVQIPEAFFGKDVEIVKLGDGTTADSDPVTVSIVARPVPPALNTEIQIAEGAENSLTIILKNPNPEYDYEFAVSLTFDGKDLVWKSLSELTAGKEEGQYLWEGLNPGTVYYVYMRVKASDSQYPHGFYNDPPAERRTASHLYFEAKEEAFKSLIGEHDGEMAKALIDQAIAKARALRESSTSLYDDLEALYDETVAALPFAREQDKHIAELQKLCADLVATGEFSITNQNLLTALRDAAIAAIQTAQTEDEVAAIYGKAVSDMKKVEVEHLTSGDMNMTAGNGLSQGSKLNVQQKQNYDELLAAIDAAIAAGKVVGSGMSAAEAADALRTLDVLSAYTMSLSGARDVEAGNYSFRLKLPDSLIGATGLQVAYYDEATGMLEVLDTKTEGTYLVFKADRIADFVIFGDPTVDLTGLIIALGLILACQLIAAILLMVRRIKTADRVVHMSTALPIVALAIRFLPERGLITLPILGIAVVVLQIVLMYLLLSSDVIHSKTKKRSSQSTQKTDRSVPVMAPVEVESEPVYAPTYEEEATDEAAQTEELEASEEEADPFLAFDSAVDVFDGDPEVYDAEEVETAEQEIEDGTDALNDDGVYVNLATGEVFGDTDAYVEAEAESEAYTEDFIEPAAATRYSLPDEEEESFAPASEDSYEEGVSEAYTWTYDDEPVADTEPVSGDAYRELDYESADFSLDSDEDGEEDFSEDEVAEDVYEEYDDYDEPVRGVPADDYPQEDPVIGDLPEYERKD